MTEADEAHWATIDAELEQLRKDATGDLQRLVELVARRGDALERREMLVEMAIAIMRHQQVMLALLRHLQWDVRALRRQMA